MIALIKQLIEDEQQHSDIDYHRGRIHAFELVLSMLEQENTK
jgi:hypothetical protein